MAESTQLQKRDGFQSKWGFILACIGSAVGMGNIWRFPIMVTRFGGMTFLIPYFIFVIFVGATGVIEEFALGRSSQAGPIGAFGHCTELKTGNKKTGELIGIIPIIGALMLAIGYTVVMGWIFKYAFMSISGGLFALGTDMGAIGGTFDATAPEAGSIGEAIGMMFSGGLFGIGNTVWQIVGLVVALIIMAIGVSGGIEKANKVMMPVLFVLFVVLAIYIATLPGASDGYKFLFTIDPKGFANPQVWVYAFGQAFFSLSVAGNGSVIYGSYLPMDEDIPSSARNVAFFDTLAALLAAFVIVPAIAASGMAMSDVGAGPGLMFVYLVNIMNGMPGGRIVGVIFYIAVLFAGLSSIINLYEAPVATMQEQFKLKRLPAVAVIGVIGLVVSVIIQPYTSQWMDIVSIYICPLGAFLAAALFFFVAGKDEALKAVNHSAKKPIGGWFYPLGCVFCVACLVALVLGAMYGGIG
ncbi:sodium-dependent transporter [Vermiculatibacterium agrestimuris]|uniref:sodium-dependent transporter n=1 Tax=Vermiculatibacterium agrestimuris TaxID=2941519 RepID=UPI00203C7BCD|nr:sodium-dependent transporter [Vermiculatibacterium agrestimuris]